MIEYAKGNMFESNADCLINTVNCEGFMGKGIAYQFKMRFPENNKSYIKACKSGELTVGKVSHYIEDGVTIINFPTKDKWREQSRIEYIEDGMQYLVELLPQLNVKKIAIPPLGCGNGGLHWKDVKNIIVNKIAVVENKYDFIIFEPSFSNNAIAKKPPQINISGLVLLDIRLNLNKFDAGRLQRAGYFTNFFAKEDFFKFDQWKKGPYSYAIDVVARNIKDYQQFYNIDNSKATFEQVYQTICSKKVDVKFEKMHIAVKKATDYINRIESDEKLEGIATVLYLVQNGESKSIEKILGGFQTLFADKPDRCSKENILEYVKYLEDTFIISLDICGNYELAQ